jgi:hypothetical protein
LANAAAFAHLLTSALNAHLTINWGQMAGFEEANLPRIQTRVLDRISRWLKAQRVNAAFIWVRERSPGRGIHTHVALYLPRKLAPELEYFLTKTFQFTNIGASTGVKVTVGTGTDKATHGLLRYLLKGVDHQAFIYEGAEAINLGQKIGIKDKGPQGIIAVKRCGTSQNIGRAMRRSLGWRDVRDLCQLQNLLSGKPGWRLEQWHWNEEGRLKRSRERQNRAQKLAMVTLEEALKARRKTLPQYEQPAVQGPVQPTSRVSHGL